MRPQNGKRLTSISTLAALAEAAGHAMHMIYPGHLARHRCLGVGVAVAGVAGTAVTITGVAVTITGVAGTAVTIIVGVGGLSERRRQRVPHSTLATCNLIQPMRTLGALLDPSARSNASS